MEQITLGQIGLAVTFIVGLIGGISYIKKHVQSWINETLRGQFASIDAKIQHLDDKMEGIDIATCKNFLVARLAEVEKGIPMDPIELERFWEQFEHYTKHGGNSYIQNKVDELKERGLLKS